MIQFDKDAISKKYLGIPYVNHGRDLSGLDCWGLIVCVYKDAGINVFDLADYEQEWARRGKNLILDNYYEKWEKAYRPKVGDVLLFMNSRGVVDHAGLYLEYGRFIQASKTGVVHSRMKDWIQRLYGIYRYVE